MGTRASGGVPVRGGVEPEQGKEHSGDPGVQVEQRDEGGDAGNDLGPVALAVRHVLQVPLPGGLEPFEQLVQSVGGGCANRLVDGM
jgi:hypothetical protein